MVTSTSVTVVKVTRFLLFVTKCWCAFAHPFPISFHMFPTASEQEEACFGAVSWICVASLDEPAQTRVSECFNLL